MQSALLTVLLTTGWARGGSFGAMVAGENSVKYIEHQSLRSNDEMNLLLRRPQPWKDGVVPFCFDSSYKADGRQLFRRVAKRIPVV